MATARGPLPSSSGGTELDRIRTTVTAFFPVYETRIGPQSLLLAVHADPATLEERFDRLRQELWTQGYIPLLRREHGEEFIEVVRRPKTGRMRLWINILLFLGTVATTSFAGALIWLTFRGSLTLTVGDFLYGELYFGAPVMTILGLHEFAHYVVARRRHLDASLPYFMPVPPPLILGTLGAFVSIREPFPDKKALFDVGAAGPLAGFAVAVPIALVGLYLSVHAPVQPVTYCGVTVLGTSYGSLLIGTPLFWYVFSLFLPAGPRQSAPARSRRLGGDPRYRHQSTSGRSARRRPYLSRPVRRASPVRQLRRGVPLVRSRLVLRRLDLLRDPHPLPRVAPPTPA